MTSRKQQNILTDHDLNVIEQNYCNKFATKNKNIEKAYENRDKLSKYEVDKLARIFRSNTLRDGMLTFAGNLVHEKRCNKFDEYLLQTLMLVEIICTGEHAIKVLSRGAYHGEFDFYNHTLLGLTKGEMGAIIINRLDELLSPILANGLNEASVKRKNMYSSTIDPSNYSLYNAHNSVLFINQHNLEYVTSKLSPSTQWTFKLPLNSDFRYIFGEYSGVMTPIKTVCQVLLASIVNEDFMVDKYDLISYIYETLIVPDRVSKYDSLEHRKKLIDSIVRINTLTRNSYEHISYLVNLINLYNKG